MNRWVWVFLTILAGPLVGVIIIWEASAQLLGASSVGGTAGYTPPVTLQTIAGFGPTTGSCTQGVTGSTCATEVATMTPASPGFVGAWALVGSNAACTNPVDTADFLIGATAGIITLNSAVAAGTYYPCVRASQNGVPSYYQQVAITVNPSQTIASMAPTNCSYQQGSASGTAVCSVAVTMSPASPPFSGACSGSDAQFGVTTAAPNCNIALAENDICSSPPCNYSLPITASEVGLTPLPTTIAITSSSGSSVPAAAAAAGFTTLAVNYDWTGATMSGYQGGQQVNLSTAALSSWLQPCGATPPSSPGQVTPFAIGTGTTNDCSAYSIVNDGGTTALKMANGSASSHYGMGSGYYQSDNGINVPTQFYAEYRARFLNTTGSNCCSAFWVVTQCSGCFYNEIVFFEMYSDDPNATGAGGWTFLASNNPENHCMYENNPGYCPDAQGPGSHQNTWNSTQYHTYGERITQDPSGDMATCFYLDGTQINPYSNGPGTPVGNCLTNTPISGYPYAFPVGVTIWAGGSTNSGTPVTNYIEYFRLWTCSGWKAANPASTGNGAACVTSSLVTSNP